MAGVGGGGRVARRARAMGGGDAWAERQQWRRQKQGDANQRPYNLGANPCPKWGPPVGPVSHLAPRRCARNRRRAHASASSGPRSPPHRAVAAVGFARSRATPSTPPSSRFAAGAPFPPCDGHSGPRPPVAAVCPWSPSPFAVVFLRTGHPWSLPPVRSALGRSGPSVPWTGGGPPAWSQCTVDREPWATDPGAPLAGAPLSP
uniref:Uncharacterized protein n=1 Tax=Oryza sativa subsp. japonica TaxID=39947 RepID=Q94HC2_ORYSJ|nr:Hypothetical protein [Oryza sativa Japonica Group]